MTEVQNTPTPVAPPLTNHFHTVPYWTHTECFRLSWVSWESCWAALLSLLNVLKLVWFSGGRLEFGVLGSTPAHSWLLNRHTVFWKSDGHTEINRARWRAPFAQCVEAGSVRLWRQSNHAAAWWTSHGALTVPSSLSDLNSARDYNHFPWLIMQLIPVSRSDCLFISVCEFMRKCATNLALKDDSDISLSCPCGFLYFHHFAITQTPLIPQWLWQHAESLNLKRFTGKAGVKWAHVTSAVKL